MIREVLGIRKLHEISAATLDRLRAFAFERSTRGKVTSVSEISGEVLSRLEDGSKLSWANSAERSAPAFIAAKIDPAKF